MFLCNESRKNNRDDVRVQVTPSYTLIFKQKTGEKPLPDEKKVVFLRPDFITI